MLRYRPERAPMPGLARARRAGSASHVLEDRAPTERGGDAVGGKGLVFGRFRQRVWRWPSPHSQRPLSELVLSLPQYLFVL